MKTKLIKKDSRKQAKNIITTLIGRKALISLMICFISFTATSQNMKIRNPNCLGISTVLQVNANGYGSSFLPGLYYKHGRNYYVLSPVLQFRKMNLAGFQLNYQFALTGEDITGYEGQPELFLFASGAYYANAFLGSKTLQNEYLANDNAIEMNVGNLCFRSAEAFGGIGLKLPFWRNFKWLNSAGLGASSCLGPIPAALYHKAFNFGLVLRSGITYDIR